ncbi:hypothetical protein [Brachybacterium endophyticum]|uniref:hypothetical protein n=1 Tax=Brachybacterium endophyticum TaxID=2182385 RepID=UPI0014030DD5|nr:hypothetical protein [Brachybacterium endophyticum]
MKNKTLPFTWLTIGAATLTAWAAHAGATGWAIAAGTIIGAAVAISLIAARRATR